jgi:galactose mutarotase-like enzyme
MIGRRLELADALFEADAVIFENLTSRGLVYGAPAGPALRIEFPDTPWLGVWTKPGAGFICVEPWAGVADPEGFDGDLRSKPGIVLIQPGARHAIRTRIQLSPTIG